MLRWAEKRVVELEKEGLCGYVFKSKSPSSGMARVKIYDHNGVPSNRGIGIFAMKFMEHFPLLPVEEEGRLQDPGLRENFIERVFALKRWYELVEKRKSIGNLVDFHTRHKLQILSHSTQHYQQLGRLVARAKEFTVEEIYGRYQAVFTEALRLRATAKKNVNVLQHMMGYFKKTLDARDRKELAGVIEDYYRGLVPLVVPVTLIRHHVARQAVEYLEGQIYLQPHPKELMLRNHV
jgi:uncharacterized protein YbgA (DUF1722 family)